VGRKDKFLSENEAKKTIFTSLTDYKQPSKNTWWWCGHRIQKTLPEGLDQPWDKGAQGKAELGEANTAFRTCKGEVHLSILREGRESVSRVLGGFGEKTKRKGTGKRRKASHKWRGEK